MKTNYFLKSLVILMVMSFVTNVTAREIVVPDGATDTDLAAALETAETGDIILIEGWVTFDAPITINKNVHFKGGENSGFDGQKATKLFEIAPEQINGAGLIFENLGFVDGYNTSDSPGEGPGDGGVGRIVNGTTEFILCYFDGNYAENRGGAFYIANPEDGTTAIVRFRGCDASGNKANGRGGFVFVAGDANTSYEYCHVEGNNSFTDRGGAFFLEGGYHRLFYTVIDGNSSGDSETPGDGERGGAAITTAGGIKSITLESCAVTNNIAYGNHGAAFFLMGNPNITLINTTIAGNQTKGGAGSWFLPTDNIDITLVNVTMVNNEGTNAGNAGGGIRIMNTGNRINIFNSILTRNICAESGEGAVDMGVTNTADITSGFVFKNSIIGLIGGIDKNTVPAAQDNATIPTKSLINMYNIAGEAAQPDYATELDQSGVDYADGLQRTSPFGLGYYTLKDNTTSYAAKLGDPALLEDKSVYSDLLLAERTIAADGSIYAGAVQAIAGYEEYDDTGWEKNISTGIHSPSGSAKQDISVISIVSNGILGVDFGDLRGRAKGDLISINGQIVEHVFDLSVIGKGYYNVKVVPGFYILKVTIEGKAFAKRVIVK